MYRIILSNISNDVLEDQDVKLYYGLNWSGVLVGFDYWDEYCPVCFEIYDCKCSYDWGDYIPYENHCGFCVYSSVDHIRRIKINKILDRIYINTLDNYFPTNFLSKI